jgi:hypothetical protein
VCDSLLCAAQAIVSFIIGYFFHVVFALFSSSLSSSSSSSSCTTTPTSAPLPPSPMVSLYPVGHSLLHSIPFKSVPKACSMICNLPHAARYNLQLPDI